MKKLLSLVFLSMLMATSVSFAEGTMETVCHDKLDKAGKPVLGKDGKPVQECKKIKVHKKLEGAETVPPKK
jgi:hypothetical protein